MRLEDIAKEYGARMEFLCVYIKEAHPTDGSQSPANVDDGVLYLQPTTADERAEIAGVCMLRYNFTFPMVLDEAGRVTWKCGLGPHYFDAAGFEAAVKEVVAKVVA